jgi:hypothetical protein
MAVGAYFYGAFIDNIIIFSTDITLRLHNDYDSVNMKLVIKDEVMNVAKLITISRRFRLLSSYFILSNIFFKIPICSKNA